MEACRVLLSLDPAADARHGELATFLGWGAAPVSGVVAEQCVQLARRHSGMLSGEPVRKALVAYMVAERALPRMYEVLCAAAKAEAEEELGMEVEVAGHRAALSKLAKMRWWWSAPEIEDGERENAGDVGDDAGEQACFVSSRTMAFGSAVPGKALWPYLYVRSPQPRIFIRLSS